MEEKVSKPTKGEMASKEVDEDTRSTTTSYESFLHLLPYVVSMFNVWMFNRTSTPRGRRSSVGSASGFSFRLEERAEKRKEVDDANAHFIFTFLNAGFFSFIFNLRLLYWVLLPFSFI